MNFNDLKANVLNMFSFNFWTYRLQTIGFSKDFLKSITAIFVVYEKYNQSFYQEL